MYLLPPLPVETFPSVQLENVTLDSSATDVLIKVSFSTPLSFKNIIKDNKIKLKLFLINSYGMEEDLAQLYTIKKINSVIEANNFIISDDNCDLFEESDKLLYKTKFRYNFIDKNTLKENKFLSIGAVFYIDKDEYIRNLNIDSDFVSDEDFCGNLVKYTIIDQNGIIQDRYFDKNKIFDYRQIGKSVSVSSELRSALSQKFSFRVNPLEKLKSSYFSNLYTSKHNGYIRLFFNLNYDQLIYDNSLYKKFIRGSSSQLISGIVTIQNKKLLRKQKQKKNNGFEDAKAYTVLQENISEESIYTNYKTFIATDFNVSNNCYYQYGVEINFSDKTNEILKQ